MQQVSAENKRRPFHPFAADTAALSGHACSQTIWLKLAALQGWNLTARSTLCFVIRKKPQSYFAAPVNKWKALEWLASC